jgi:regulator of sirC expression with transglutaminase-like and TPR domain
MDEWLFRDELQVAAINVPRAALQMARAIAYPNLNIAGYMMALHELSEAAADAIDPGLPAPEQIARLSNFLFEEEGFRGNAAEYGDPRNSFLNEVIDRRLGIPISLSVLYIDIAERLGLSAYGIGLPGHFIVGVVGQYPAGQETVHAHSSDFWIDPFHGGRRLDLSDCADLIRLATGYQGPLEASWFAPMSPRNILARMLNNLRSSYVQLAQWASAERVIQLLRQTQPDAPEHLRDLGLVYYHQRRLSQAAHYLNAYLNQTPEADDAQVIRDGMKDLLDSWVPLN